MRARRGVYAVIFLVAALGASALVYFAQPRNGIVRAKVDIAVLTPITAEMVEVVSVSPADAPANAARSLEAVVGRYASVRVLTGQDVDVRVLDTQPSRLPIRIHVPARTANSTRYWPCAASMISFN
jgi:flagella basal body P-ring formation protein FlgA